MTGKLFFPHDCSIVGWVHQKLVDSSHKGAVIRSFDDSVLLSLTNFKNKQLICWILEATWRPRKVTAKIRIEKGGLEAKFQPNLKMFLYWCRNSRQGKYKTVILPSYIYRGNTYTSVCGIYIETGPLGSIWLQQYYCMVIVHLGTADPYHLFTCWIWPYLTHGLYQRNKRDLIIWRQQWVFWSKVWVLLPRSSSYLFNITYSLGLCPISLWLKNLRTGPISSISAIKNLRKTCLQKRKYPFDNC